MIKSITKMLFLPAFAISLSAQAYDDYDISKFVGPEFYRTELSFSLSGDLSGNNSNNTNKEFRATGVYTGNSGNNSIDSAKNSAERDYDQSGQNLNFSISHGLHYRESNTDLTSRFTSKIQFRNRSSESDQSNNSTYNQQNSNNTSSFWNDGTNNSDQSFSISSLTRYYLDDYFGEFTPDFFYSKSINDDDTENSYVSIHQYTSNNGVYKNVSNDQTQQTNDENDDSYSYKLPFALGFGRIENVTDARMTIYLLEELTRNGYLENRLSDAEINRIAMEVNRIKNHRVIDSRERDKYFMTALDSVLSSGGYLKKKDVGFFNTLKDNWIYGSAQNRRQGWSCGFGVENFFRSSNSDSKSKEIKTINEYEYFTANNQPADSLISFYGTTGITGESTSNSEKENTGYSVGPFFEFCEQIDLYSQWGIYASYKYIEDDASYVYSRDRMGRSLSNTNYTNFENRREHRNSYNKTYTGNVRFSYDYFPNSRTSVYTDLGYEYSQVSGISNQFSQAETKSVADYQSNRSSSLINFDQDIHTISGDLDLNYYFTDKLNCDFELNCVYRYATDKINNKSDNNYTQNYSDYSYSSSNFSATDSDGDSKAFYYRVWLRMNYTFY